MYYLFCPKKMGIPVQQTPVDNFWVDSLDSRTKWVNWKYFGDLGDSISSEFEPNKKGSVAEFTHFDRGSQPRKCLQVMVQLTPWMGHV